jgi:hypothetical protein
MTVVPALDSSHGCFGHDAKASHVVALFIQVSVARTGTLYRSELDLCEIT